MKIILQILILFFLTIQSYGQNSDINQEENNTIKTRFTPPQNYIRVQTSMDSFDAYLQNLPLKPENSLVKYYDGKHKQNYNVYDGVVDLKIGNKNLHQCADAVMRLRAEYLWKNEEYDKIHFNFTNGFRVDYSEWIKGRRIIIEGNKTYWNNGDNASNTYQDFWKYMELIFTYAGTSSLSKELVTIPISEISIGDIFIIGGFPGHAIIVVDMAKHEMTGEKVFLLAQSYMPAQETQILKNPRNKEISPWYSINFGDILCTPEFSFNRNNLKRFKSE